MRCEGSDEIFYFPDLVKKLLKSLSKTGTEIGLSEAEERAFFTMLNKDYWKKEEVKKIAHSIEAQNVHVQSVKRDGKYYLQLSNAEHKQKKHTFSFLKEFSELGDEKQREELLVHFKQLILLFYYGRKTYEETVAVAHSMTAWDWKTYREEDAVNFDNHIYELVNRKLSSDKKDSKRQISDQIRREIRNWIAVHYREAVQTEGLTEEDIFWLQYIEKSAEKILKKSDNPIRLSVFYLCDHTYKEWLSYLCMKFIALGKGVYHFTVPDDMDDVICGKKVIGEVLPEYRDGITSFDYERIKAEEDLDRDMSLYISFAVNNFSNAVRKDTTVKNTEDVLFIQDDDVLNKILYPDSDRRIFQFFGGKSSWENKWEGISELELVKAIKEEFQLIRNSSFHYTAKIQEDATQCNQTIVRMFHKEYSELGASYQKKYASNNVLCFYSQHDIINLMNELYRSSAERPAQVPAFNRIYKRKNFGEFVNRFCKKRSLSFGKNNLEWMEKFRASLFFLLKEIYYYGFLQEKDVKDRFIKAVNDLDAGNSSGWHDQKGKDQKEISELKKKQKAH